jgi:aryl-alcohol dehydrogenase-like predicted oxidoreductase
MQTIEIKSIQKVTSRIGLGCGRLFGRHDFKNSALIVEEALKLGIRYFDLAPSYGMGTAEEVVGQVIGNSKEITIATKVGIPRPSYSNKFKFLKSTLKPILDSIKPVKKTLQKVLMNNTITPIERNDFLFTRDAVEKSLLESLKLLRRESVDVYLLHEPRAHQLNGDLLEIFKNLKQKKLISTFGVGVRDVAQPLNTFGDIWQSKWPGNLIDTYNRSQFYIWHGVLRSQLENNSSTALRKTLELSLMNSPNSIILISASKPNQLKELLC